MLAVRVPAQCPFCKVPFVRSAPHLWGNYPQVVCHLCRAVGAGEASICDHGLECPTPGVRFELEREREPDQRYRTHGGGCDCEWCLFVLKLR